MIEQEIQNLRAEPLDQLKQGISEPGTNILLVQGPLGIGKTSLINALGGWLESTEDSCLWLDTTCIREEEDLLKFPQLLSHSIQTNASILKSKVEEAARELGREAFRLEALATQAGAGTAENADPLPDLAESWGKIMREKLLVPITDQDGKQTAAPRTVILLEDFETFNKPQQLWIKEHLIEGFTADAEASVTYLVTTTQDEAENTANFFPGDKISSTSIVLEPFSVEELEDLLLKVSLPEVDPEDFLKETNGFPEAIKELAGDLLNKELEGDAATRVEEFLAGKTPAQLEWIAVTAHLPEYNAEGFRLYFEEEEADEAYKWLGNQSALVKSAKGRMVYDEEMKVSLLQWTRKQDPSKFQTHNQMASQYIKLLRKFDGMQSCEYVNHLACLNFFNDSDLEHLFGSSASEYSKFIEENPQYFETSGRNQRVLSEYLDVIQEYRALLPSSTTEALRKKALEQWSEKASQLEGEIRTLKQRKTVEESKLREVRTKIAELDKFFDQKAEYVSDEEKEQIADQERRKMLDEEKHSEVNRRVRSSKRLHTVGNSLLILIGIAFFYFGILTGQMSDPSSIKGIQSSPVVPCLFGTLLIVAGILRPLRERITIQTSKLESRLEKKQAKALKKGSKKKGKGDSVDSDADVGSNAEPDVINPDELSGAENLVMFKRSRIEAQADEIQKRVDNLREAVKEIEQTLEEPLVA